MGKKAIAEIAAAIASSAISGVIGNAVTGGSERTREIYTNEKNPPFAPPGWAFPIAWGVNNTLLAWVAIQAWKAPNPTAKKRLLTLLGAHGALFFAWPFAFVRLRSPILATAVTAADLSVNLAAAYQAARLDKPLALSFVTTNAWLSLALALAAYIALHNDDMFLGIKRIDRK